MSALTSAQLRELADQFSNAATLVEKYRNDHNSELTDEEWNNLNRSVQQLQGHANTMRSEAIEWIVDDAKATLDGINASVDEVQDFLKAVAKIKKAIRMVAGLLDLATAIAGVDLKGVKNAIETIKTVRNEPA
jgi:hypothetical protein